MAQTYGRGAQEVLRQAKRLQQTPPYYTPGHPDHEHVHDVVKKLYEHAYGRGVPATPPGSGTPFVRS